MQDSGQCGHMAGWQGLGGTQSGEQCFPTECHLSTMACSQRQHPTISKADSRDGLEARRIWYHMQAGQKVEAVVQVID